MMMMLLLLLMMMMTTTTTTMRTLAYTYTGFSKLNQRCEQSPDEVTVMLKKVGEF
jgi:hypothetical protein